MANVEDLLKEQNCVRVFGYGSLIWRPDFEYDNKYIGYIKGYERRFWQGSVHHRGTSEKPGRVLTLTKTEKGRCHGVVYEITGEEKVNAALMYLNTRECKMGGYQAVIVPVIVQNNDRTTTTLTSILYYATPQNDLFLNDFCMENIADSISSTRGVSGYNCEYLLRVTDFMRKSLPGEEEDHLYALDRLVRVRLGLSANNKLPWTSLVTIPSFHNMLTYINGEDEEHLTENAQPSLETTVVA